MKPKSNDDDESLDFVLGVGSYQFIHGGSGKAKTKQIGFIRNDSGKNKSTNKRPTSRPAIKRAKGSSR